MDRSDADSVIGYLVDYTRMLAGGERPFAEAAARDFIRRDVERTRNFAALQNHDSIHDDARRSAPLSAIARPTLVIHGTADPMFPAEHGDVLAQEIPNTRLLRLKGAGHGVCREDWATIVEAILEHTA